MSCEFKCITPQDAWEEAYGPKGDWQKQENYFKYKDYVEKEIVEKGLVSIFDILQSDGSFRGLGRLPFQPTVALIGNNLETEEIEKTRGRRGKKAQWVLYGKYLVCDPERITVRRVKEGVLAQDVAKEMGWGKNDGLVAKKGVQFFEGLIGQVFKKPPEPLLKQTCTIVWYEDHGKPEEPTPWGDISFDKVRAPVSVGSVG
jgi:hypothetical protein